MTDRAAPSARIALTIATVVNAAALLWLSFVPPPRQVWKLAVSAGDVNPVAHGQLALVMLWSALGPGPRRVRWPVAAAALWLVALPLREARIGGQMWRIYLAGEIVPHALLALTLFGLCRQAGLRIVRQTGHAAVRAVRPQYDIPALFAFVSKAALLAFACRQLVQMTPAVDWPRTLGATEIFVAGPGHALPLALIDGVTLWCLLRNAPLRILDFAWAPLILTFQTAAWRAADHFALGRNQYLVNDMAYVVQFDALYLLPLVGALLLARAAGYRLVLSRASS